MLYKSYSIFDTKAIACNFSKLIKYGDVILLFGELGSGKTTFSQGIIQSLGVKDIVNSPTYNIIKEYVINDKKIYHIDLYRLPCNNDLLYINLLYEYLDDQNAISIVEWPEYLINKNNFKHFYYIKITINKNVRDITILYNKTF